MYGKMSQAFDDEVVDVPVHKKRKPFELFDTILKIAVSTNSQLEFLTLLGIILNGIMTGYVTQNTIYRFLV